VTSLDTHFQVSIQHAQSVAGCYGEIRCFASNINRLKQQDHQIATNIDNPMGG